MTSQSDSETLYLVEDYSEFCSHLSKNIIALTPEAAYEFSLKSQPYSILEDFYSEKELEQLSSTYLDHQLNWFRNLNRYLRQKIPTCLEEDLDLLLHLRFRVKYFCDSIFSLAYIFREMLSKHQINHVVYVKKSVSDANQQNRSLAHLNDNSRRFMFSVCQAICKSMEISIELEAEELRNATCSLEKVKSSESGFFKGVLKSLYYLKKYPRNPFKNYLGAATLFLTAGHKDLDSVFSYFLASGRETYLRQGKKIIHVSGLVHREVFNVARESESRIKELEAYFIEASEELTLNDKYFSFIKKYTGADLRELFKPYLKDFIRYQCLETAAEAPLLKNWLEKSNVQLVLTNSATNYADASIMQAARNSKLTKRVCFQHGCHALEFPMWRLSQEPFFDFYFATDPETREYSAVEFRSEKAEGNCEVREYREFLQPSKPRKTQIKKQLKKEKIFYVPTRGPVGVRIMNAPAIPMTWYAQFQRDFIDFLAQDKEREFVFKYIHDSDWLSDTTLRHVKKMNYSNVRLESAPFWKCLESADRIIMDHPGTAFYESLAAGLPVIALYLDHFKPRETTKKYFAKNLCPIQGIEDAKSHIKRFLESPAEDYRVNFELTRESPIDFLVGQVSDER